MAVYETHRGGRFASTTLAEALPHQGQGADAPVDDADVHHASTDHEHRPIGATAVAVPAMVALPPTDLPRDDAARRMAIARVVPIPAPSDVRGPKTEAPRRARRAR